MMTADFCRSWNELFDCMNARTPVNNRNDPRLHRMASGVKYFTSDWVQEVQAAVDQHSDIRRDKALPADLTMFILQHCVHGILATVDSFLAAYPGKGLMLPRLNQDFVENFSGLIRSKGGVDRNPNALSFRYKYQAIWMGRESETVLKANARGSAPVPLRPGAE